MIKLLNLLLLLSLSSSLFAGGPVQQPNPENIYNAIDTLGLEKVLKILGKELSKNAPMQVDSVTQLNSAVVIGKRMTISYSLNTEEFLNLMVADLHDELGKDTATILNHRNFIEYLENVAWLINAGRNCSNVSISAVLSRGALIEHVYISDEGNVIFDHVIDGKDCLYRPSIEEVAKRLFVDIDDSI